MQGLAAAQHRRHRLHAGAHDVVVRLLPGERATRGLRVKTQLQAAVIFGAKAVTHDVGPDFPRGAILGNFLEKVAVRIKEEAETRGELVNGQPARERPLDILDAVAQREGQFLHGGRPGFADVIAADRNRIEARRVKR